MSDEIPSSYPSSPHHFRKVLGMIVSALILLGAVVMALMVKENIRINPRTEDAQVRANVVGVVAQVGGYITAIHVKDNQPVRKGDLLFELDERPYAAELDKAKAQLALTELEINAYKDQITSCEAALRESEANALYASNYAKRIQALVGSNYVTNDKNELAQTQAQTTAAKVEQDKAALERAKNLLGDSGTINVRRVAAQAAMRDAELKLSYCKVYAPCDGYVTNLQITPGVYASIGEQIFSIVDRKIWYVLAYFRETDLRHLRPGMAADVYTMAESGKKYHGIVQGIPKAVTELGSPSENTPGGQGLLSQVSPTIDFILLAQRYPVRVVLDQTEEHSFRMGGTASVIIHTKSDVEEGNKRLVQLQKDGASPYIAPVNE
jgi:multidrug efflux system membrane fusion protein